MDELPRAYGMRQVPPWVGKMPDTPVPPRVKARLFDAYDGRCQCGCDRKIRAGEAWDLDHYVALINGGANSELNMRPMLTEHHKHKTAADMRQKSKSYRIRSKHIGIKKPRSITRWRRFNGDPVYANRER